MLAGRTVLHTVNRAAVGIDAEGPLAVLVGAAHLRIARFVLVLSAAGVVDHEDADKWCRS